MQWPQELVALFDQALEVVPVEGLTKEQVIRAMFDETARRAVWRAQGDPEKIREALRWPYTPLGSVVTSFVEGRARRLGLEPQWGQAVEALHTYIERNAPAILERFQDEWEPYAD